MKKIRVLVVDDSAFMRRVISDIINKQPDMEAIGTSRNGKEALEKIKEMTPDVVTLDVEMPVMDGLEALERIMTEEPMPVIMLSSLTQSGADATMRALQRGAVDFIPKPSGTVSLDIEKVSDEIINKIRVAAGARASVRRLTIPPPTPIITRPQLVKQATVQGQLEKMVVIGTSTGGPKALHEVIPQLPGNLAAGVLVVQHMPPGFTKSLAERLDSLSNVNVKEAEDGEPVYPGCVYIAPGDFHLKVKQSGGPGSRRLNISLTKDPAVSGHRPSVDAMFESAISEFWSPMVGVVMTGMGADGAKGVIGIKQKGGIVIAEDKSTCIVFGMPKSVIETGCADKIVPLPQIAQEIARSL
ncbi:MAG: protein-glutamate methylesterase/protein-glutamine glutaminase [Acidobacteriota bacterium]